MFSCGDNNAKGENCFSEDNFKLVYQYINKIIITEERSFFKYSDYNIYLVSDKEIVIKKNGWTIAKIKQDEGIVALAMRKADNDRQLNAANKIFCKLLSDAQEKRKNSLR